MRQASEVTQHDRAVPRADGHAAWTDSLVGQRPSMTIAETASTRSWRRLVAWVRTHPRVFDSIVATVLFVLAVVSARLVQLSLIDAKQDIASVRAVAEAAAAQGGEAAAGARRTLELLALEPKRIRMGWVYAFAVASTIPLVLRRRFPGSVHVVVFTAFLMTQYFSPFDGQIATVAAFLSTYTYAAYSEHPARLRQALLVITAFLTLLFTTGVIRNHAYYPDPIKLRELLFGMCVAAVLYGSSIAIGQVVRRQRETAADLAAHATALASQQEAMARTAVLDERVRIARELHDVVAHHVSVMGMQAGAARLRLGSNDSPVSKALTVIEESSREAVADLYRLLGLLRSTDAVEPEVQSPQPSLDLMPQLIADHRAAGYELDIDIIGELDDLPATTSLTAYRILQEALTNIRKHGSAQRPSQLMIVRTPSELRFDLANPTQSAHVGVVGRPSLQVVRPASQQLGIRGMKERAALLDGEVSARMYSINEFRVQAKLPVASRAHNSRNEP